MRFRPALLVVLLAFPLAVAAADTQPIIPHAGETIEVSIVDFDVVVTDKRGHRIHGLTKDDFEVFENKQPQAITNFAEYSGESPQREKRTIVFFIERFPDARFRVEPTFKAIKKALHEIVATGDSVLIATWNGAPVIALDATDDLNAIDTTLDAIAEDSIRGGASLYGRFADPGYRIPTLYDTVFRRYGESRLRVLSLEEQWELPREQMRDEAAAVNSLINAMSNEGGRKALFLMTHNLAPLSGTRYFYTIERGPVSSYWHDYYRNSSVIDTIKATAIARNVAVYALQPGEPGGAMETWNRSGPDPAAVAYNDMIFALRDIAKSTGGFYATGNDIAKSMPRVRDDFNDYYSLAYRVPARNDNRVRAVSVKAKNSDYVVRTRKQYIEKNDDVRVRDQVIASLFRRPAPAGISVDASVGAPVEKGRHRNSVPVSVRVPASSFMTSDDKGAFSVYVATGHDIGRTSDITKRTVAFTSADLKDAKNGTVEYDFELVTDTNANLLSIGVYDELSHDSGFTRVDLPRRE